MNRVSAWLSLNSGVLAVAIALLFTMPPARAGTTERVSVSATGASGNEWSRSPSISADGRFVAFYSYASNLVPGDTNGAHDVFRRDRVTGETVRVSLGDGGQQGNADSRWPSISADGRFVAFESQATNLVPTDTNDSIDVFVHDVSTGRTEMVSISDLGTQGNDMSWKPAISADGIFVAFTSLATNLVPLDANGEESDVFVYDRHTGRMELVSVSSEGAQGDDNSGHDWARPAISAHGSVVAFVSDASNLVPGDTNGVRDVFVRDRNARLTERVSVSFEGKQGDGPCDTPGLTHGDVAISDDGLSVAFVSQASNLVPDDTNAATDVFVRDRTTATTERVSVSSAGSQADGAAADASISTDGKLVVFASAAQNLVAGKVGDSSAIYLHDRSTGTTQLVTTTRTGQPSIFDCMHPTVTSDGHFVCFVSEATDMAGGDTNDTWDVLVHDRFHTRSHLKSREGVC